MSVLNITWEFRSGDHAVWEVEHLFGTDVFFGMVVDDRYIPVRMVSRTAALPTIDRMFVQRNVCLWSAGKPWALNWAVEQAEKE